MAKWGKPRSKKQLEEDRRLSNEKIKEQYNLTKSSKKKPEEKPEDKK